MARMDVENLSSRLPIMMLIGMSTDMMDVENLSSRLPIESY